MVYHILYRARLPLSQCFFAIAFGAADTDSEGTVGGKGYKDWSFVKRRWKAYTVKKVTDFSVPGRDVSNQTLPGLELFNYSPPEKVWLVTSRPGTGKSVTFLQCRGGCGDGTAEAAATAVTGAAALAAAGHAATAVAEAATMALAGYAATAVAGYAVMAVAGAAAMAVAGSAAMAEAG